MTVVSDSPAAPAAPDVPGAEALPGAAAALRDGMARGLHAGAQLYVSLGGRMVADFALGEARPGVAMTSDTLVPWLSAGKPLTAVALARLWERGLLDIDDPVAKHLPEYAAGGKHRTTLRHLLTHTSGVPAIDLDWVNRPWPALVAEVCAATLPEGVVPGVKAAYDPQANWFALGEVVRRAHARVTAPDDEEDQPDLFNTDAPGDETPDAPNPAESAEGRAFARILVEEVFAPLGMADSWMGLPADRQRAYGDRVALLHESAALGAPDGTRPAVAPWDTPTCIAAVSPGGGARGPVRELARLYECLLRRGALALAGGGPASDPARPPGRLLAAPTVEALTARHRVDTFDTTFRHKVDWGLGFLVDSNRHGAPTIPYGYGIHASPRTFGHGGRQSVAAFADPVHGLAVAVFFNGLPGEARHSKRIREFATAVYADLGLVSPR